MLLCQPGLKPLILTGLTAQSEQANLGQILVGVQCLEVRAEISQVVAVMAIEEYDSPRLCGSGASSEMNANLVVVDVGRTPDVAHNSQRNKG